MLHSKMVEIKKIFFFDCLNIIENKTYKQDEISIETRIILFVLLSERWQYKATLKIFIENIKFLIYVECSKEIVSSEY